MANSKVCQNIVPSSSSNGTSNDLEEAMWKLKVGENNEGLDESHMNLSPDRSGTGDCPYYLRTGICGYGNNCKYNHPAHGQGAQYKNLPERFGQPECQFFLKTGICKFGATCKFNHPRERYDVPPAPLNMLGLPIRENEKPCPFYLRTRSCKFGTACKFNHPELAFGPPASYGPTGLIVAPPSDFPSFGGGLSTLPLAKPYLTSPKIDSNPTYMPVVLPPYQGAMQMQQSWNNYMPGYASQLTTANSMGSIQPLNRSTSSTTIDLPERPDQPECQYYMKRGSCKFGTSCKYNHPKGRRSESLATVGPFGFPLRPGNPVCNFYAIYGTCKYGPGCKYDHPFMGYYNYATPAVSVPDTYLLPQNHRSLSPFTKQSFGKSPNSNNTGAKSETDCNDETNRESTPAQNPVE